MTNAEGRLAGRRAVVTGAGQGIGRAAAIAFAREGAHVVAVSRTAAKLDDLPGIDPRLSVKAFDLTDAAALDDALREAGEIDILLNCAGWVHTGTAVSTSDEDWERSFAQNVTAPFRAIRTVLPGMIERGRGAIVNVASVASSLSGVAERVAYGASKAGLIGLTKAVARETLLTGVRCNALCPGTTMSPSLQARIDESDDPDDTYRRFVARQPMGRLGTMEEMAAACVYLAGDESAFMTGQLLIVDGGQTL